MGWAKHVYFWMKGLILQITLVEPLWLIILSANLELLKATLNTQQPNNWR